jgi:hypothetical protein
MYTSGCPKNQNRCCQSSAEPPCAGSKNAVPKLRSSSSIVTVAASDVSATTIRYA